MSASVSWELIKYLKTIPSGPEAVEAIKTRTRAVIADQSSDPMVRRVLGYVNDLPDSGILDVGCYGGWLYHLRPNNYIGCDIWPEAIQAAREVFPAGDFRLGDVLDFKEKVDFVWCSQLQFGVKLHKVMDHLRDIGTHGIAILMGREAEKLGGFQPTAHLGVIRW